MSNTNKKSLCLAALLSILFIAFTIVVRTVDVQPIGPEGSSVGLAAFNQLITYEIRKLPKLLSDLIMYPALLLAVAELVYKYIKTKKLDWVYAGAMVAMVACYLLFEKVVINCRPVPKDGLLEASYPSSHCLFAGVILGVLSLRYPKLKWPLIAAAAACCVLRLFSGVHWLTDIIGGVLLAVALVLWYHSLSGLTGQETRA